MKKTTLLLVFMLVASMHWLLPRESVAVSPPVGQTPVQTGAPNVEERIARIECALLHRCSSRYLIIFRSVR